jgi:hypothetical protein
VHHGDARDFYYRLSLPLYLSLSLSLTIYLFRSLSFSLSLSLYLSFSLSLSPPIFLYLSHSLFLSDCFISNYLSHGLSLFTSLKKSLQFQVLRQNPCSCGSKLPTTHLLYRLPVDTNRDWYSDLVNIRSWQSRNERGKNCREIKLYSPKIKGHTPSTPLC